MIQDAIKNKLSTCSLCWDPSDICTKMQTSCLNRTRHLNQTILSLHFSYWQIQACGLCQKANTHLYTVSSVDKIEAVIVITICFWRGTTLAFKRNQVSR